MRKKKLKPYPKHMTVICKKTRLSNRIKSRDCLTINLKNRKTKKITFIMMNPSKANRIGMDKAIDWLIQYIQEPISVINSAEKITQLGTLHILNVFPLYVTESKKLQGEINLVKEIIGDEKYEKLEQRNQRVIKNMIKHDTDYLVLAWGDPPKKMKGSYHQSQITPILNSIRKTNVPIYIFATENPTLLTLKNQPRHISRNLHKIKGLYRCSISESNEILTQYIYK